MSQRPSDLCSIKGCIGDWVSLYGELGLCVSHRIHLFGPSEKHQRQA